MQIICRALRVAQEATLQSKHNRDAEIQRTQQTQIQHDARVHEANEQTRQETARQETERTRLQTQREKEQAQIQRDVDIRTAEEEARAKIEAEKEGTEREKIQKDREVRVAVERTKQEQAIVEQKRIDADAALKTAEIELRKAEIVRDMEVKKAEAIRDAEREKTKQIELGGNRAEYLEHLEDRIAAALARIAEQQSVIRNNNQQRGRTERAEYGAQNSMRNY